MTPCERNSAKRRERLLYHLLMKVVRVVYQQHIDAVEFQPLQALLKRAQHTVSAEVEYHIHLRQVAENVCAGRSVHRIQHTPNLC